MCEDHELWAHMMRDVKKIKRNQPVQDESAPPHSPEKSKPKSKPEHMNVRPRRAEDHLEIPKAAGRGLDRKTAEKLRKGQMPIEGRLDLHGMRQAQAHEALNAFIMASYNAGRRCVLVITGKGAGEDGRRDPLLQGQGILKRKMPEWLRQGSLDGVVLKTEKAQPRHGGDGALYVLLRRRR